MRAIKRDTSWLHFGEALSEVVDNFLLPGAGVGAKLFYCVLGLVFQEG